MRAIHDPEHRRIFCLVHAEKLTNLVCDEALHSLSECSQGHQGFFGGGGRGGGDDLILQHCDML